MDNRPQVFMCLPRYGAIELGSALGFASPCSRRDIDPGLWVDVVVRESPSASLTARTFNLGWAKALAMREAGRITHFAMIHADISPRGPWLNVLYAEMKKCRADVISAVVPIKNHEGATSTAIGDSADPWGVHRRIMMADRNAMPETFAHENACKPGEVLLINTGLMLIDMAAPWWDGFAFEVRDRIVRRENGDRIIETIPEDWAMSRYVYANGGRVAATWKVPLLHHGTHGWRNDDSIEGLP